MVVPSLGSRKRVLSVSLEEPQKSRGEERYRKVLEGWGLDSEEDKVGTRTLGSLPPALTTLSLSSTSTE